MPKPPGLSRIPLRWRAPGLRERLLAYLIVFWFLPVLIGASALLVVQRREAQADAIRHLEVLAGSREAVLQDWRANALEHANELAAIVALCLPDVTGQACDLQEKVSLEVAAHDIVVEVSLLDPVTGEVIFSSDPAQEGKIRAREDYFISGLAGPSLSRVFYDLTLDAPTQMASVPVRNRAGALVSVVALRLNVHRLDTRIVADTGLGKIGDVYLVNRNGLLLTSSRYEAEGILRQVISSDGAKRALAGESGWAFYDDYRGIPVLGVYRWLPEANQALLVEVDRGMVFRGQQIVLLATLSLASVFLLAGV
ncbi:MAG: cache domain-containing protein, partial [Anaerolineales bacterium]